MERREAERILSDKLPIYRSLVVELGMGDGKLLRFLAESDIRTLFVGIEIDSSSFKDASSRMTPKNLVLLHGSFEDLVPTLADGFVDKFLIVLPDPAYIDPNKEPSWREFYRGLMPKLKETGRIELVTEITDDLLQPVSDENYYKWVEWLKNSFKSIGFVIAKEDDGSPANYSSRCLDQFRGDPERIRIVTLTLSK